MSHTPRHLDQFGHGSFSSLGRGTATGGGGGGGEIFDLALAGGTALGDLATGGLFSAGSNLLGGLAGLLQGPTDQERRQEKVFNLAQNRLGQDVFDPSQFFSEFQRNIAPEVGRNAELINKRLGLDSGAAQAELFGRANEQLGQGLFDLRLQNEQLKSSRDNSLLALMAQLSQG